MEETETYLSDAYTADELYKAMLAKGKTGNRPELEMCIRDRCRNDELSGNTVLDDFCTDNTLRLENILITLFDVLAVFL